MKNVAMVVALSATMTLAAHDAAAEEWVQMHDFGPFKLFLSFPPPDPETKPLMIWKMQSFKEPQRVGNSVWKSMVILEELDCRRHLTTTRKVIFYPGDEATGAPLKELTPNETEPVMPGAGAVIFDLTCNPPVPR